MSSPNVLITNYCNQNCPFCFASREMNDITLNKEMKMEDFKRIVTRLSQNKDSKTLKFLGGEPTLHSKLFEMIDLSIQKNFAIQLFTNGIIGKDRTEKLMRYGKQIGYTFNITTPGFRHNSVLRKEIVQNMSMLGKKSNITISLTIDPFFNQNLFFSTANSLLPALNNIRIGLANPIAHTKNWYDFSDFPKMGGIITRFMQKARNKGFKGLFAPNCGFTRCMFTDVQYKYFKLQSEFMGWSCFGKTSSMDIGVDLQAFHCFPLSDSNRFSLVKTNYKEAVRKLMKVRMEMWAKYKKEVCLKCPFYGYGGEKCPGPCLAFRMNE